MKLELILLPLDIRRCPIEAFATVNGLANDSGSSVILLHVVTLNIAAPEKGVYEQLGREAHWHLERLAGQCVRPGLPTSIRVRFGEPAEEILAEAATAKVDLIVLASKLPSFWRRLFAPIVPRVVERVVREAACGVFLTTAKRRFDGENFWGRPGHESDTALDHLEEALDSKPSPARRTAAAFALARGERRAAA
jgi:nucleotide-binding universal stress UspA family protein